MSPGETSISRVQEEQRRSLGVMDSRAMTSSLGS